MISQDVNKKNHPKPIDRLHTKFPYCDLAMTCQLELIFLNIRNVWIGPSDENPWLQPRPVFVDAPATGQKALQRKLLRFVWGLFRLLCALRSVPIPMCQHLPSLPGHSFISWWPATMIKKDTFISVSVWTHNITLNNDLRHEIVTQHTQIKHFYTSIWFHMSKCIYQPKDQQS